MWHLGFAEWAWLGWAGWLAWQWWAARHVTTPVRPEAPSGALQKAILLNAQQSVDSVRSFYGSPPATFHTGRRTYHLTAPAAASGHWTYRAHE